MIPAILDGLTWIKGHSVWTHNALRYTNTPPLLAHIIYIVVLVKEELTPSLATHKTVYINQPNREEGDFLH